MALCDTIDPNESININNKVGATTPPILTSPRTDNTLPSPIPQSTSLALQQELLFSPACLEYDHYNGVTIDLECIINDYNNDDDRLDTASTFQERLQHQLQIWKAEGIIRGVWIHIPPRLAAYVPACIENGFDFHMVTPATGTMTNDTADKSNDGMATSKSNVLILSQWLPNTTSRLPIGPTHQVGVGCLIWHPDDPPTLGPQRRLLVVQEKSGPAATFQLWKLPTGLADPNEDIHDAAIRELYEETGLVGHFDGLLLVRQAHPNVATTGTVASAASNASATTLIEEINTKRSPKKSAVQRKVSDLFFICQMTLQQQQQQQQQQHSSPEHANKESKDVGINTPIWTACPNEIAAIQWMSVQDYCQQQRWQSSPLYMMLNRVIMEAASTTSSPVESNLSDDLNSMKGPVCMTTTKTPLWNETTLPVWVDNKNTTSSSIGGDNPNAASKYTNTFYSIK
jgi:ADP-ribose pyrophosphatase YjhB (NUDIX family)